MKMNNVMAFVLVIGVVMALSFLFVFLVVVVAISDPVLLGFIRSENEDVANKPY